MASLTPVQERVFLAVYYIETNGKGSVFASAKNVAALLSGDNNNPNAWFYQLDKKLFGSVPKMNVLRVIGAASGLVEDGYLRKESIGGHIRYFLTGKDPYAEDRYLFSWDLTEQKKKVLVRVRTLIDRYFGHLVVCHEQSKYVGYKRLPEIDNEGNWFWISNSQNDSNAFSLKVRRSPEHKTLDAEFDFSSKNIIEVLLAIKDVVDPYNHITIETKKEPPSQETLKAVLFNSFIPEPDSKDIRINGTNDPVAALLALGDSTPFYYRDDTNYVPSSCNRIVENKKNFDFSMAKWKLVAWTVLKDNPRKVQEALIILKKTKALWMVVSIPSRSVICLSKAPFSLLHRGRQYTSGEVLSNAFD